MVRGWGGVRRGLWCGEDEVWSGASFEGSGLFIYGYEKVFFFGFAEISPCLYVACEFGVLECMAACLRKLPCFLCE